MKCPCLYSAAVPTCRADTTAIRIPTAEEMKELCLGGRHRSCELFQAFIASLSTHPERWRAPTRVRTEAPAEVGPKGVGTRSR